MAIPKQNELYNIILEALKDGDVHELDYIRRHVKRNVAMTRSELLQKLPSGRELVWHNRLGWSIKWLKEAGLLFRPKKAHYQITEAGQKILSDGIVLDKPRIEELIANRVQSEDDTSNEDDLFQEDDPISDFDAFERMYDELNNNFADILLSVINDMPNDAFERLTNRLLSVLGYGDDAGIGLMIKSCEDGNINGIIYAKNDHGFDLTYLQFNRRIPDDLVAENKMQQFIETMAEQSKIDKKLLLTTATLSDEAKILAKRLNIDFFDANDILELMTEYNIGVTTRTYELKYIDRKFFMS